MVFVPFNGASSWRVCFPNGSVLGHPGLGAAHTPNHLPLCLCQCFRRSPSSSRGAFLLPSTRGAYLALSTRGGYLLTDSLAECQVQSKLKPRLSSPYNLFKRRISNGSLWADVCHCVKRSRTLPQTSLPVGKHWVASRERLTQIKIYSLSTQQDIKKCWTPRHAFNSCQI